MTKWFTAAAAKSLQSCPTLCNPIDGSPPGSPVPGILQARTLEWVAISFSKAWKWKVKSESEVAQSCPTQWPHGLQPTRLLHPWDFPGKSTGVGWHGFLQILAITYHILGFPGIWAGNEFTCTAGDPSSIPELERFLEKAQAAHLSILGLPWWLRQ